MRPSHYLSLWEEIKPDPTAEALQNLARRIGLSFIDRYFYSDQFESGYIELLCEMSTEFSDSELNNIGANALFGIVIEQLCDDFEELQTETYNRLMCQVITFLRSRPECAELDIKLTGFGLASREQLYDRIESIRANGDRRRLPATTPRKILLLSRVTIGADVAISSVFCQRLKQYFPAAEIVLIGSEKLEQVYAGNKDIRVEPLTYVRRSGLAERLNSWIDLHNIIKQEQQGLEPGEVLLFDPDSRLSQLGVLPLIESEYYYYFNSRGKDSYPKKIPIAELANIWLGNVLGPGNFCYPGVWPEKNLLNQSGVAAGQARRQGVKNIITMNFGVGGNHRKKITGKFESELVIQLLQETGTTIFLDLGFGDEERTASENILSAVKEAGLNAQQCSFEEIRQLQDHTGVIGVECSVGEIASLIAASDEFIGYDSACQHISAALGKRTYTVFAGTTNIRFIRRWTACGPNVSEIIYVDTLTHPPQYDTADIVARLLDRRDL